MENESKNDKFKRIAKRRVNRVLNEFRMLGNLKGSNYSSTKEQRNEMLNTIREAFFNLENYFAGDHKKEKMEFKFKGESSNGLDDEPIIDLTHNA